MITAADLMTKSVISIAPETKIADVAHMLLEKRITAFPVVDADQHLLGMVSEGDLVRSAETDHDAHRSRWLVLLAKPLSCMCSLVGNADRTVEDVMCRDILLASENESLSRLIELLATTRIKRLPVVKEGKLVGIVSRVDILRYLAKTFSRTGVLAA